MYEVDTMERKNHVPPKAGAAPRPRIAVIGPHRCSESEYMMGFEVGATIGRAGAVLICGGLGGMMQAAAEGARSVGGITVGILPGEKASDANEWIDLALPTGLGPFRNMLVVRASDAVVAIRGGYGTLSELAFALRLNVPVVGLYTWSVSQDGITDLSIRTASGPSEAAERAIELARARLGRQNNNSH